MAVYIRTKQATDPLDERVRALLRDAMSGYASSGSEHEGDVADDDDSSLSELIHGFLDPSETTNKRDHSFSVKDSTSNEENDMKMAFEKAKELEELLDPSSQCEPFRLRLRSDVKAALLRTEPGFRRGVVAQLKERGYNAGICKVRWESGTYEYIDVIDGGDGRRYIVDLGFAAEFELARPSEEYVRVVKGLPEMVVARPEEVKAAVLILSEAAQRSLKKTGLCVPPWRENKHLIAKWLGAYRRTANMIPSFTAAVDGGEGNCRTVGFCTGGGG